MPTSRELRAQRLMRKSTLQDIKMPVYMPKHVVPPDKENDLYPLRWPGYKSSDVQNKINDVLGPLSLFAPYPHEDEPERDLLLERPVTPINEEIKTQPYTFDKLSSYVRRRIAAREGVPYLSTEDQQDLAAVIMGEVNSIWPDIRRQIDDPFLTAEENKELNRRIAVHIVTVCEKLFHHYLHKAQILNERGVFSGPANMSRLKAQLALDADKFLNILTMRRYLVADMRGKVREEPAQLSRLHSTPPPRQEHKTQTSKPLTFTSMIKSSRPKSSTQTQKLQSVEQDLKDIAEAMPYLDTGKLVDLVADLPDRGIQTPSEEKTIKSELKEKLQTFRDSLAEVAEEEEYETEENEEGGQGDLPAKDKIAETKVSNIEAKEIGAGDGKAGDVKVVMGGDVRTGDFETDVGKTENVKTKGG